MTKEAEEELEKKECPEEERSCHCGCGCGYECGVHV